MGGRKTIAWREIGRAQLVTQTCLVGERLASSAKLLVLVAPLLPRVELVGDLKNQGQGIGIVRHAGLSALRLGHRALNAMPQRLVAVGEPQFTAMAAMPAAGHSTVALAQGTGFARTAEQTASPRVRLASSAKPRSSQGMKPMAAVLHPTAVVGVVAASQMFALEIGRVLNAMRIALPRAKYASSATLLSLHNELRSGGLFKEFPG
eukprot:c4739_g1_i2.p1 GENE.c4739_g1_i2~~c4739_g1_i2.p1  ORF type:complete len:206 (+),score=13.08 c4739_g1_i2:1-618(+)